MKIFVLMNRRTGELMEGCRVALLDQAWADDIQPSGASALEIITVQHDGWVIRGPEELDGFTLFFNHEGTEEMFENLGEL